MLLQAEVERIFEERMAQRGQQALPFLEAPGIHFIPKSKMTHCLEFENNVIPYDQLVNYLFQGDIASFEAYFEGLDVYDAERIRENVQV